MHKLQNVILEMKHVLFDVMEYAAKLDCLIAFAVTAKEYNWVQPTIASDGEISVVKGRHPLLELCVASCVSNDINSGGSESKIKVITGPNSSGKSMYLQQVALITFMAHLGSFVPAQSAKIPTLGSIFTCMNPMESVSLNLSSFLITLNQMSSIMINADHSLVIVDEFGNCTDANSGLALLVSCLDFWIQKRSASPHVFLATHFLSLNRYLTECPFIKFLTMDMIASKDLVFLHQLVDGIAVGSFAAHTALTAGLPEHVIRRSLVISKAIIDKQPIETLESKWLSEKLERYSAIYNEFSKLDLNSGNLNSFLSFVKDANVTPKRSSRQTDS